MTFEAGLDPGERLADYLTPALAARARDAAALRILVLDCDDAVAGALTAILAEHGAFAQAVAPGALIVACRSTLAKARDEARASLRPAFDELLRAFDADAATPQTLRLRDRTLDLSGPALVMGILNVTPDSFYDKGRYRGVDQARARAAEMVELGADLIDVGGQSYAAWNAAVAADEERARVVPVVEALLRDGLGVPLSIDTYKAPVAEAALAAGADLINDCSGLSDGALAPTVARYDAGLVVMHLKGELNVRAAEYRYDDALGEIIGLLRERTDRARAVGVAADALIVDPGLEFGKEPATDLEILERFGDLRSLGYPILFAASRKSFIGRIFDRPARELLVPSLATAAVGIAAGARLVRVHDVAETKQLARMLAAIRAAEGAPVPIADKMPE